MIFSPPLIPATFLKRYKRFFADLELNGEIITAHVPNTGSMKTCLKDNCPALISHSSDPKRKLAYTLEFTKPDTHWVGVNTNRPNALVEELFQKDPLDHWKSYDHHQRELKISEKSRVDLVLWNSKDCSQEKLSLGDIPNFKGFHFIEVKNVSLREGESALFPDSVSTRAQKHLEELMELVKMGHSAEIFFCVNRGDVKQFSPAKDIDPKYAELLKLAVKNGVKATAILCSIDSQEYTLTHSELPIHL